MSGQICLTFTEKNMYSNISMVHIKNKQSNVITIKHVASMAILMILLANKKLN